MCSSDLTRDVLGDEGSVGTTAYTEAIIGNLGRSLPDYQAREVRKIEMPVPRKDAALVIPESVELIGVDVFFQTEEAPDKVGEAAQAIADGTELELKMVECRGTQVWPKTSAELDPTDVMRARFITRGSVITSEDILELLGRFGGRFNWVHVEKLRMFDGEPSFSRAQGEK